MGARTNPVTGEKVWDFIVPIDQQPAFYHAHPPRALEGLTCAPVEVSWEFDGHGEPVNAVFELACPCGSGLFAVTGSFDDDGESPRIAVRCGECDAERVIFDASKHGYDGALGNEAPGPGGSFDELVADAIGAPHQVIARFEFASEILGDQEWRGREQDLFTWFTLLARDPVNGHLAFLFEWECA